MCEEIKKVEKLENTELVDDVLEAAGGAGIAIPELFEQNSDNEKKESYYDPCPLG